MKTKKIIHKISGTITVLALILGFILCLTKNDGGMVDCLIVAFVVGMVCACTDPNIENFGSWPFWI